VHEASIGQSQSTDCHSPERDPIVFAHGIPAGRTIECEKSPMIFEDVADRRLPEPCEQIDLGLPARHQGLDARGTHRAPPPAGNGATIVVRRRAAS
jgi:hypothetical protein